MEAITILSIAVAVIFMSAIMYKVYRINKSKPSGTVIQGKTGAEGEEKRRRSRLR